MSIYLINPKNNIISERISEHISERPFPALFPMRPLFLRCLHFWVRMAGNSGIESSYSN